MVQLKASFLTGATNYSQLPKGNLPEFAFIGRSNVGKSTLINAVTRDANLAKISKTPGRTQQINFFQGQSFMLVDLPGYGYAKAPVREVRKWQAFNLEYMQHRQQLKVVFILVDARRGIGDFDLDLVKQLFEWNVVCQILYTKADKLGKKELEILKQVTEFNSQFPNLINYALITSGKTQDGIAELVRVILANK